jgi:hypothetical protein
MKRERERGEGEFPLLTATPLFFVSSRYEVIFV